MNGHAKRLTTKARIIRPSATSPLVRRRIIRTLGLSADLAFPGFRRALSGRLAFPVLGALAADLVLEVGQRIPFRIRRARIAGVLAAHRK